MMPPNMMGMGDLGPPQEVEEGFKSTAGAPLVPGTEVATEETVIAAMRTVYDPEIPVNIYDIGLIYSTDIAADGSVKISMSLTSPMCPVAGELPGQVAEAVAQADGVGEVEVIITWEPPWNPEMMHEDAKLALGII